MKTLLFLLITASLTYSLNAQLDMPFLNEHADEIVEEEGRLHIRNEEEAEWRVSRRITILNENSVANVLRIYYDPDNEILDFDAAIYDQSGKSIRRVKNDEIRDFPAVDGFSVYNDLRVQILELNYSQYPYVIEFEYRQRISGLRRASPPSWYFQDGAGSAVRTSRFVLKLANDIDLQYRMYNASVEPTIEHSGRSTTYTWEMNDIPAFKLEPYMPAPHRTLPMLRYAPDRFRIDEYNGNMSSWKEYGRFMSLLYQGRDVLPASLQTSILDLTAQAESDTAKINILYRYLQDNYRYVSVQLGIGGWQPFDAAFVAEYGYGDCKALSNFMKAMLQVVGIESYPAIIHAGRRAPYAIEDDFVDPEFNHVILYVPAYDIWLDCTQKYFPVNYLGSFCNDRRVLLITPDGGQIARTPRLGRTDNVENENALIALDAEGGATIEFEGHYRGIDHEYWRSINTRLTSREIEDEVQEFSSLPALTFHQSSLQISPDTPHSDLQFTAQANRYATRVGKRIFVPLNAICPRESVPEAIDNRRFPIHLQYSYTEEASLQFLAPTGFQLESLPESPILLETDFATYELSIEQVNDRIVLNRRLALNAGELAADRYDEFRTFFMDVARHDSAKMVLVAD